MPLDFTTEQLSLPFIFEEWRAIPGFEGCYEASNLGRVRGLSRMVKSGYNSQRFMKSYMLKPWIDAGGYYTVNPWTHGGSKGRIKVHRLVALTFLGECPKGLEVNHIDGNKLNNCVTNLEYITHSENAKHAFRLGLNHSPLLGRKGIGHKKHKLAEEQVSAILLDKRFQKVIANDYNVSQCTISNIKTGKIWGQVHHIEYWEVK